VSSAVMTRAFLLFGCLALRTACPGQM
jgi:hypothetical protein